MPLAISMLFGARSWYRETGRTANVSVLSIWILWAALTAFKTSETNALGMMMWLCVVFECFNGRRIMVYKCLI